MPHNYCAYGLHLAANEPLPGLHPLTLAAEPAVRLAIAVEPPDLASVSQIWYTSAPRQPGQAPNLRVWRDPNGQRFRFRYGDGAEFLLQRQPATIWADWAGQLARDDMATYLLGPILGFWLRWQGVTCLHASAIAVDGLAIALVGNAGAGKSTTAAAFAAAGYPILTDDVAALAIAAEGIAVQPAYPRLRLWSEAVELLYGRPDALPRLVPDHPDWDKRYLDLGDRFQAKPLPLAAIYRLANREADGAPRCEAIAPSRALVELIANTYTNYLLDKTMRQQEFTDLSRLVQQVPVRRAIPHRDPAHLPAFVTALLADCQTFRKAAATLTL